jgi:hypothetical protein
MNTTQSAIGAFATILVIVCGICTFIWISDIQKQNAKDTEAAYHQGFSEGIRISLSLSNEFDDFSMYKRALKTTCDQYRKNADSFDKEIASEK